MNRASALSTEVENKAVLNLAAIVVDERPQEKIFAAAARAPGQF